MKRIVAPIAIALTALVAACEPPSGGFEPLAPPAAHQPSALVIGEGPTSFPLPPGGALFVNPNRQVWGPPAAPGRTAATAGTFVDGSGNIETKIWWCINSRREPHPVVQCAVDSGYVLVGGGAWVSADSGRGAFLTASYPFDPGQLTTWEGRSKDHLAPNPHLLVVFAVGMKFSGMSRGELLSAMAVSQRTSGVASLPNAAADAGERVVLGVGCIDNWHGAGNMLTTCSNGGASGKDHLQPDPASITHYLISTASTLATFNPLKQFVIETGAKTKVVGPGSGVLEASVKLDPGFVPTTFGAVATYNGTGRLLTRMSPTVAGPPEFFATSEDHLQSDSGALITIMTTMRVKP
jgi:hypothetical protein